MGLLFSLLFVLLYFSCDFTGTQEELEDHLKTCKFESMKEFLHRTDEKISDLQFSLNSKDQEIGFLRSMLGKLSERVETLERNSEVKLSKSIFFFFGLVQLTCHPTAKISISHTFLYDIVYNLFIPTVEPPLTVTSDERS